MTDMHVLGNVGRREVDQNALSTSLTMLHRYLLLHWLLLTLLVFHLFLWHLLCAFRIGRSLALLEVNGLLQSDSLLRREVDVRDLALDELWLEEDVQEEA